MNLNAIISGGFGAVGGWSPGAPSTRLPPVGSPSQPKGDTFSQGQYDQNQVHGASEGGGTARQAQARRAYAPESRSGQANDTAASSASAPGDEPKLKATPLRGQTSQAGKVLSEAEKNLISQLQKIDSSVRAHENAHLAAAGGLAKGGASFSMAHGPDGRSYAVGGEVQIDTSGGATPAETIAKMQAVRAAALAPADPSSQDLKVAAQASLVSSQAVAELGQMQRAQASGEKVTVGNERRAGREVEKAEGPQPTATKPVPESSDAGGANSGYEKYALAAAGSDRSPQGAFNLIV